MNFNIAIRKQSFFCRSTIVSVTLCFLLSLLAPSAVFAQSVLNLPSPGAMVGVSPLYTPPVIQGITINPENPLEFDFLINDGDETLDGEALETESLKLIKYFMTGLTVPEDQLWVNLSPYESDRIVPEDLGQTEMGRDLLAQDYLLKQLTSSLMHPDESLGQEFWNRVYAKAQRLYGTTDIPMNTFNKIWIVPQTAEVYVHDQNVFVINSHLKVLIEEDYLALENHTAEQAGDDSITSGMTNEIVREVLIPEIEYEVNKGKTFANLRQIFSALILAKWYKENLRSSFLGQVYVDQSKTNGITASDLTMNQKIYDQYVEAFETGVYDFVREERVGLTDEVIPRKYFSGGVDGAMTVESVTADKTADFVIKTPELTRVKAIFQGDSAMLDTGYFEVGSTPRATKKAIKDAVGSVQFSSVFPFDQSATLRFVTTGAVIATAICEAGCGGGGGSTTPTPTPPPTTQPPAPTPSPRIDILLEQFASITAEASQKQANIMNYNELVSEFVTKGQNYVSNENLLTNASSSIRLAAVAALNTLANTNTLSNANTTTLESRVLNNGEANALVLENAEDLLIKAYEKIFQNLSSQETQTNVKFDKYVQLARIQGETIIREQYLTDSLVSKRMVGATAIDAIYTESGSLNDATFDLIQGRILNNAETDELIKDIVQNLVFLISADALANLTAAEANGTDSLNNLVEVLVVLGENEIAATGYLTSNSEALQLAAAQALKQIEAGIGISLDSDLVNQLQTLLNQATATELKNVISEVLNKYTLRALYLKIGALPEEIGNNIAAKIAPPTSPIRGLIAEEGSANTIVNAELAILYMQLGEFQKAQNIFYFWNQHRNYQESFYGSFKGFSYNYDEQTGLDNDTPDAMSTIEAGLAMLHFTKLVKTNAYISKIDEIVTVLEDQYLTQFNLLITSLDGYQSNRVNPVVLAEVNFKARNFFDAIVEVHDNRDTGLSPERIDHIRSLADTINQGLNTTLFQTTDQGNQNDYQVAALISEDNGRAALNTKAAFTNAIFSEGGPLTLRLKQAGIAIEGSAILKNKAPTKILDGPQYSIDPFPFPNGVDAFASINSALAIFDYERRPIPFTNGFTLEDYRAKTHDRYYISAEESGSIDGYRLFDKDLVPYTSDRVQTSNTIFLTTGERINNQFLPWMEQMNRLTGLTNVTTEGQLLGEADDDYVGVLGGTYEAGPKVGPSAQYLYTVMTGKPFYSLPNEDDISMAQAFNSDGGFFTTSNEESDDAMLQPEAVGGIDLNPENYAIQSDGTTIEMIVPQSPINPSDYQIDGLTPIIIQYAPVTNIPMLLGIADINAPIDSAQINLPNQLSFADRKTRFDA